ncbi:MAG: response regulator transcription factor [Terriglobia bacterium]|jgi:DNA-binding NarL/FixJ family response regulator
MRVLIADDSEVFVQRLVQALGEISGVEIVGRARTGAEALQALRDLDPEVVILDIRMPDGTGIDVLEGMRKEKLATITIVLTNFAFPQYRRKCLQLGARFFFDKSAEFAEVREALSGLIHKPPAPAENRSSETEQEAHQEY